jgi:hypothetical protein
MKELSVSSEWPDITHSEGRVSAPRHDRADLPLGAGPAADGPR